MVNAYDLVAIVYIINGPATTNQGKRAMGMLDAGYVGKERSSNFQCKIK